jgi:1-acyl-sn-glycerol-3-phosphate acyltransferase
VESWRYESVDDLALSPAERLKSFPRSPDMVVYGLRTAAALIVRTWLRCYHRLDVRGREHLPREGSFVMVANHSSHLDALCLLTALPLRQLHCAFPAAASDYFFESLPRAALATVVCNAMPFGRKADVRESLLQCAALLRGKRNVLILFPEGTRSPDDTLGAFRPGIGALVAGTSVPVVPCALVGAGLAWPKGRRLPRPRKVVLEIGAPRDFAAHPPGRASAELVAQELRLAVAGLQESARRS